MELRKQVDTRASLALLLIIVAGMLGFMAIELFVNSQGPKSFEIFQEVTLMPLMMFLPVIAILAVTSEWSQRTALVTFVWEPRRGRVMAAKYASSFLLAFFGALLALGLAAAGTVLAEALGADVSWAFAPSKLAGLLVTLVLVVAQGIAFGLLIQNTPGAIVAYFVLPTVMTMLSTLVSWIGKYADWIDLTYATMGVSSGEFTTATISRAAVAVSIWIILPGVLGLIRMWRREIK